MIATLDPHHVRVRCIAPPRSETPESGAPARFASIIDSNASIHGPLPPKTGASCTSVLLSIAYGSSGGLAARSGVIPRGGVRDPEVKGVRDAMLGLQFALRRASGMGETRLSTSCSPQSDRGSLSVGAALTCFSGKLRTALRACTHADPPD